ncbi:DNA translocase FtsK 4TM domain-containing protein [Pararhodobacter sp. SW119]|uniref:DNA translocase FtsK n=1 Tax=Pararhodobacter sp. SW119 TaxID=2780075 RepID=UPI001AE0C0F0|nr:DNA translocase FtsK 4TM domain-containing protein [Pararhodobacter sp. SW119]
MASYHSPQREPLLDRQVQAQLTRRGRELLGLALIALAALLGLVLWTYAPEDPGWMAATDGPVQNALGRPGATVAAPVVLIAGRAGWGIVVALSVWGIRLILDRGVAQIPTRAMVLPIAICVTTLWLASLVPGPGWALDFGLGGMFGDTLLGAILTALPIGSALALNLLTLTLFLAMVAIWMHVLGLNRQEIVALARAWLRGLVLAYAMLIAVLTGAMRRFARAILAWQARREERRDELRDARKFAPLDATAAVPASIGGRVLRAEPAISVPAGAPVFAHRPTGARILPSPEEPDLADGSHDDDPLIAEERPTGLLARVSALGRRMTLRDPVESSDEARIRNRITDVIRARKRAVPSLRVEPVVPGALAARTSAPDGAATLDLAEEADPDDDLIDDDTATVLRSSADEDQSPARRVVQPAARRNTPPSSRARAEAQPALPFDTDRAAYELPPLGLLTDPGRIQRLTLSDSALEENARMLESVLDDYGVKGEIVAVRPGPVVTLYELEPAPGLKASRVIGLADDIARSMSALSARVSTVPGRSVIGIELPNARREKVVLREILGARDFGDSQMRLPLALGKDIGGEPVVANLAKMPHLLIAGTTGSGKSVAINTMILSLLYKLSPDECRLIMIDPKMLELSVYDGIPHLLSPVVTDPKKAVVALKWVVGEMEERYRKMSRMGVRNIDGFNGRVREALAKGEMFKRTVQTGFDDETGEPVFETEEFAPELLPFIVVIVDEMADLMMVAGKEIEACIQRLAQMARASGIHLIMATQRPSVDVITGTIKANFPTRISFQVTSKIDSRTILGEQGAEQLLGMGDMLYMAGGSKIIRVHGPFVSDEEVEDVVRHLKSFGPPEYMSGVVEGPESDREADIDLVLGLGESSGDDALYDQAVAIVARDRKCSTSYIQRKLGIGYNKAARLVEQMEDQGVVTSANHVGKREILVPEA